MISLLSPADLLAAPCAVLVAAGWRLLFGRHAPSLWLCLLLGIPAFYLGVTLLPAVGVSWGWWLDLPLLDGVLATAATLWVTALVRVWYNHTRGATILAVNHGQQTGLVGGAARTTKE